jgi:mannose-6-phosphate isomerase-like protein (cupin superfamily)
MLAPDEQQAVGHLPEGEGEILWVLGLFVTLKAHKSEEVSFYEAICPPEAGPPPNIHYQQDEAFYVVDGTFSFLSGDRSFETGPGSVVSIPRGTVHTFKNIGESTGKCLIASTLPGSHEGFFRDVGVPVRDMAPLEPPGGPPDMKRVLASAEGNDIHFVQPEERRGSTSAPAPTNEGTHEEARPGVGDG